MSTEKTYTCLRCGRVAKSQIVWSIFRGVFGWYCKNRGACAARAKKLAAA